MHGCVGRPWPSQNACSPVACTYHEQALDCLKVPPMAAPRRTSSVEQLSECQRVGAAAADLHDGHAGAARRRAGATARHDPAGVCIHRRVVRAAAVIAADIRAPGAARLLATATSNFGSRRCCRRDARAQNAARSRSGGRDGCVRDHVACAARQGGVPAVVLHAGGALQPPGHRLQQLPACAHRMQPSIPSARNARRRTRHKVPYAVAIGRGRQGVVVVQPNQERRRASHLAGKVAFR